MIYCKCDAPLYTESVNVCRRCLRPVVEVSVWNRAHTPEPDSLRAELWKESPLFHVDPTDAA